MSHCWIWWICWIISHLSLMSDCSQDTLETDAYKTRLEFTSSIRDTGRIKMVACKQKQCLILIMACLEQKNGEKRQCVCCKWWFVVSLIASSGSAFWRLWEKPHCRTVRQIDSGRLRSNFITMLINRLPLVNMLKGYSTFFGNRLILPLPRMFSNVFSRFSDI